MGSMQSEMKKLEEMRANLPSRSAAPHQQLQKNNVMKEQKRLAGIPERHPQPPPKPEPKPPKPTPSPEPGAPPSTPIQAKEVKEQEKSSEKPVAAWNLYEYSQAALSLCEELEHKFLDLATNLEKYSPLKEEQALKPGRTYRDLKSAVKEMRARALNAKRVAKDMAEDLRMK